MPKKTSKQLDREIAEALGQSPGQAPAEKPDKADDKFDREWRRLADRGAVDGFGGAEYRRVKSEWISAGRPPVNAAFIRTAANWVPDF